MYRFFVFVPVGYEMSFFSGFVAAGGQWWEICTQDFKWFKDLQEGTAPPWEGFKWARFLDYSHLQSSDS